MKHEYGITQMIRIINHKLQKPTRIVKAVINDHSSYEKIVNDGKINIEYLVVKVRTFQVVQINILGVVISITLRLLTRVKMLNVYGAQRLIFIKTANYQMIIHSSVSTVAEHTQLLANYVPN